MKIAIFTLGTRGDVQPYAVLGKALKLRGHKVVLSTAKNFESLVKSYGLDFVPVDADYQALLNSPEGKKIMGANPFAIKRNLNKWIYPLVEQSLTAFYELAKTNDRVIYHVKTLADSFADQFPDKMIRAMVVPAIQQTNEFPNPAFSGIFIPSFLNKWSYRLTNLAVKMFNTPIGRFRERMGLPTKYALVETNFIYGISQLLLPKPKDFPENSFYTGFWFGTSEMPLEESLLEFLKEGEPPLLVTFGSMPFQSKFDVQSALITLTEKFKIRILVVKGWGLEHTEKLESYTSIKVIGSAPYEKLFPLVRAIIHHGGAGTTAECLRAGKPFLICPILYPIGDQQFWGKIAYDKGVGLKPLPLKKMTADSFISNVEILLNDKKLYENAEQLSRQLMTEDGVVKAIELIESNCR
jgi:sterol 3beta-glucosyltransferase